MLKGQVSMTNEVDEGLRSEVRNLFQYIQRLREEIAGVASRQNDQTAFESMSDQLDAVVAATESATNTILEGVEVIETAVDELRTHPEAGRIDELCNQISERTMASMEACSFQDITGQRVSKIVGSMKFVEARVEAMVELWGRSELDGLGDRLGMEANTDDGVALEGPALPGESISQDAIDDLFD